MVTRAKLGDSTLEKGRYTLEVVLCLVSAFEFTLQAQVVEGDRAGLKVWESLDRDPDTGGVKKGTKFWDIAQACLPDTPWVADLPQRAPLLEEVDQLVGRRFTARIFVDTWGDNRVRHRTVKPWTPYSNASGEQAAFIQDVMRDLERL